MGAERSGEATGPTRARSGRGPGSAWSGEEGSGSSCLDSPPRVPPRSSCRGRHFPSWPRAAYSRGRTPRAVRCGRGLHQPPRTAARLAGHPGRDPGRGAGAVRGTGVRRHLGPRGRGGRRGGRGAGAPLLRDQGRPVRGRARAACRSPGRPGPRHRGRARRRGGADAAGLPVGLGQPRAAAAAARAGHEHRRPGRPAAAERRASCRSCSRRSASPWASTTRRSGCRCSPARSSG